MWEHPWERRSPERHKQSRALIDLVAALAALCKSRLIPPNPAKPEAKFIVQKYVRL